MSIDMDLIRNQAIVLLIVGVLILVGQKIGLDIDIVGSIPGILMIVGIAIFAVVMRALTPNLQFPAFAWASLTALILSMPFMPTSEMFLKYTNQIDFLATTTPILAFAGISVGNKIMELKKLSWKVAIVSIFVFTGTFFGSAIVAQIVLKMQGII